MVLELELKLFTLGLFTYKSLELLFCTSTLLILFCVFSFTNLGIHWYTSTYFWNLLFTFISLGIQDHELLNCKLSLFLFIFGSILSFRLLVLLHILDYRFLVSSPCSQYIKLHYQKLIFTIINLLTFRIFINLFFLNTTFNGSLLLQNLFIHLFRGSYRIIFWKSIHLEVASESF